MKKRDTTLFQDIINQIPLGDIRQSVLKTIYHENINNDLVDVENEVLIAKEQLTSHCLDLLLYALEISELKAEVIVFYDGKLPDLPEGLNRLWFKMFLESLDYLSTNTALDSEDVESLVFSTQKLIFNLAESGYELPLNLHIYRDHSTGQINLCYKE